MFVIPEAEVDDVPHRYQVPDGIAQVYCQYEARYATAACQDESILNWHVVSELLSCANATSDSTQERSQYEDDWHEDA